VWVMIRRLAGKSPARRPQRSPAPEPLPAATIRIRPVQRFRRRFVLSYGMHHDDFDRALARHHGRIFTFATYLLSSRVEAEDVTQEVFVKLWRSGDAVPPERVGAWLLRVTRNACFDHLRRRRWQRRFTTVDPGDPPPDTASRAPGPEVLAAASELGRRLLESLARLGEPHRSIVILRHVEGLSCREIGEVVDMTEGSVRVALHRARRRLRDQLREAYDGAAIA
jgi:RNA polymerase sigma factor (sigma-70 family)